MTLQTICYFSNAQFNLSADGLEKLFSKTKANNARNKITGILIYRSGNFLQILEGEKAATERLYNSILKDERHKNVIKIIDSKIEDSIFTDYKTGFSIIMNHEETKDLDSYIDWLENSGLESVTKLTKIIHDFIKE
jgi:hypothetical protein